MNCLETKISKQVYDIIQKHTSALFRDATLDFYGIQTAKIKELINVDLPVLEVREKSTDIVFLLEDNRYLHLEFQSSFSKKDLVRFVIYDSLLYERDKRHVDTVVIYSSEVKKANARLNVGTVQFNPQVVMFDDYDGNAIYHELEKKLESGQELSDEDLLNLIFLPLMKTNIPKDELAGKSIRMAQSIPDENKRNTCIASIFAFASKYLKDEDLNKLLEAIKMSDLATMLITERNIEIAKKALREGAEMQFVQKITDLDISTIQRLKDELGGVLPKEKKHAKNY